MKFTQKPIRNIWTVNEDGLGFYCINIFPNTREEFDLTYYLDSGILNEKHLDNYNVNNSTTDIVSSYGNLELNKIDREDFIHCSFSELESLFEKYWKEDNWGDDLDVFKKHYKQALLFLDSYKVKDASHYFICSEWLTDDKKVEQDFFVYLVCVISDCGDQVIVSTFGLD